MLKKNIKIKLFAAVFILIISSFGFTASSNEISNSSLNGNTLYVGGSGPGNYSKIQDAVDNASDGDTVFVYSGTYYEFDIFIKKSISLIGENKSTTIIDTNGGRKAIKIFQGADEVIFKGFTIQNATLIGLDIFSNNNIIKNNIFCNNWDGIRINNNSNIISNNIFSNNDVRGVRIFFSAAYNTITENIIENNGHNPGTEDDIGGVFIDIDSYNNIIRRNDILNNSIGVHLDYSQRTIVKENNFIGNKNSAYFYNSFFNRWNKNYWDDLNGARFKLIKGRFYYEIYYTNITFDFPMFNFDIRPAQEPYEIPGTSNFKKCVIR